MSDTITVDLERAKQLLTEVCEADPTKVDTSTLYFDPNSHECMCVVGAVIEKLGKGYDDMRVLNPTFEQDDPNLVIVDALVIDGIKLTDEAALYLDIARSRNDAGVVWSEIPASTEQGWSTLIAQGESW